MSLTPVFAIDNTQPTVILGKQLTFEVASVATEVAGSSAYAGTFTGGAANAFAGMNFSVYGFLNTQNDGLFPCTASSATSLTLTNPNGIAETAAARATTIQPIGVGVGNAWAVPGSPGGGRTSNFTWSISYTGSPTVVSVNIEGSNDGINWEVIDNTSNTAGETRYVANNPFTLLRANAVTLTSASTGKAIVFVTFGR